MLDCKTKVSLIETHKQSLIQHKPEGIIKQKQKKTSTLRNKVIQKDINIIFKVTTFIVIGLLQLLVCICIWLVVKGRVNINHK